MTSLSPLQMSALLGVVDTLLPSLPPESNGTHLVESRGKDPCTDIDSVNAFWQHDLTQDVDFCKALLKAIQDRLDPLKKKDILFLLDLLSSPMGSWLLFFPSAGLFPPVLHHYESFAQWNREKRHIALKSLQQSRLWQKRMVFNGLKQLIAGIALTYTPDNPKSGAGLMNNPSTNVFWKAMGYGGPYHWGITSEMDEQMMLDSKSQDIFVESGAIISLPADIKPNELEFDCIIIGSGCGGSVMASALSQAGYSVLVIEKGSYVSRLNTSQLEGEAYDLMYENHALQTTADGNIMIFAGSTLGGATAVNYACCIELPENVRQEWSELGLKHCHPNSSEFNCSEELVLKRIGGIRSEKIYHNGMNTKLIEGSKALDHKWSETKQNLSDTRHDSAGYTCFGDRYGNKQGMTQTFLRDAVESGCKILEDAFVERILFNCVIDGVNNVHPAGARKATGVLVRHNDQLFEIRASRCVVCAAGALNTPCLLTRSGFKNPHIGKHLHLHPVSAAYGIYNHDIKGWLGAPMTSCNNEYLSGPNRDGYGARIECPPLHPGVAAAGGPWQDSRQFKQVLLSARKFALCITLQRDIGEGQVKQGPGGKVRIDYELHPSDKKSIVAALKGTIQILIASGAERVSTMHVNDQGFAHEKMNDPGNNNLSPHEQLVQKEVQSYLQSVEEMHSAMHKHKTLLLSAHQMGTCRFGVTPAQSACDENGELWECDSLFVADTSIFPTASGSNPMVTVLTLSHMLSKRLVQRLKYEDTYVPPGKVMTKDLVQRELMESRWQRRRNESSKPLTNSYLLYLYAGIAGFIFVVGGRMRAQCFG